MATSKDAVEQDIAELKKNIVTDSQKDGHVFSSAGECQCRHPSLNTVYSSQPSGLSIISYCIASILMTLVNKVCDRRAFHVT